MSRRSRRRRRQRRARHDDNPNDGLLGRIWEQATSPKVVGLLCLAAGVLLMVTPWMHRPNPWGGSWWAQALYLPDVLAVVAGLGASAVVLMLGMLLNRVQLATNPGAAAAGSADAVVPGDSLASGGADPKTPVWAWAAALCMLSGLSMIVGAWFYTQQGIRPARMPIAVGQTRQHYRIPVSSEGLDVNLGKRVRLDALQIGAEPVASLQVFDAGQTPPASKAMPAGSGLELPGFRLTFTGLHADPSHFTATFGSQAADTISVRAAAGDSFQIDLDGASYDVVEITDNYMGVMGPAAKIRAPDLGEVWVFERAAESTVPADLGHSIELRSVQTRPEAVFTVARSMPFWPLSVGGTLFVLGIAALILVPEHIIRPGAKRSETRVWSFHEAGRLVEQIRERDDGPASQVGRAKR